MSRRPAVGDMWERKGEPSRRVTVTYAPPPDAGNSFVRVLGERASTVRLSSFLARYRFVCDIEGRAA